MSLFILLNTFFIAVSVIGLIILWFVLPPDSPWSPWWQVGRDQIRAGLKLAKVSKKDIVYDLGSGDGRIPIVAARDFGAKGVGIEFDYLRHFIAITKVKIFGLDKKVKLIWGNFFDYKISDATIIYVYLVPRVLEKLKPKLFKELKRGTKILSYRYNFKPDRKIKLVEYDKKNEVYLYKIT